MYSSQNPPENLSRTEVYTAKNKIEYENRAKNGANWFFWIAGLSLVNSIVILFGGEWTFIVGLGITQFIDGIAWGIAEEVSSNAIRYMAFFADLVVIGFFAGIGYFARQKKDWSFLVGMTLYALDVFIFILVFDIIGIAFHILALYFIYNGYRSLRELLRWQQPGQAAVASCSQTHRQDQLSGKL